MGIVTHAYIDSGSDGDNDSLDTADLLSDPFAPRESTMVQAAAKKPKKNSFTSSDDPVATVGSTSTGTSFTPMHWIAYWDDENMKQCATVAISLPSGIDKGGLEGKFEPKVSSDGMSIVIKCEWPDTLYDMEFMQMGWMEENLSEKSIFSMLLSCEKEVNSFTKNLGLNKYQTIYGTARINLKMEVEREIKECKPMIDDETGGVIVYLILKQVSKDTEEVTHSMAMKRVSKRDHASTFVTPNHSRTSTFTTMKTAPNFFNKK